MEYRQLGKTELQVSSICLGTMTWGQQNTEQEAYEQLEYATSHGVNFIDTAEMYPIPPNKSTYALTETYIGNWLTKTKKRDQIILATKVTGPSPNFDYMRGCPTHFDRKNIETALENSLKRLKTETIDLYQLHWPDRSTNFFGQLGYEHDEKQIGTEIEETLSVLHDIAKTGKVRHFGLSNETPWGTMQFLTLAEQNQWPRMVSIQNPYSLLNRTFEVGLAEVAHREQIGLLAYSPLGFGVLSGKYLDGKAPKNSRLALFPSYGRYSNPQAIASTEAYIEIARQHQLNPAQMALAFVTSRPFVTSNIIGATTLAQLKSNIESVSLKLDSEVVKAIESVHTRHPNPSP